MKNQVNLYPTKLHPKLRLLSLPLVIVIWSTCLLAVILLNTYLSSKQQSLQDELNQLDKNNIQKTALISALKNELDNLKADPELIGQVAKKQQIAHLKKRVYQELIGQEKSKSTGFSDLMLDLAEHHQTDIWLTRVYLNEQNVTIEGATTKSSSIPIWVNNLSKSNYFKGQEFSATRIFRDETQQIRFVLTTGETTVSNGGVQYE
ncbi:PilN domain-containing protein [Paraglaciecola aquimarina]|uniref:PilN domain-containing protein n=1 Tax=Paraglaciecola algarum TaxID=3050085 RepID=A0ABS9D378_9ALTE|nr:PilN domain-containing protein [Paraglaciecola sp. G1-23]MCF2947375.1 PilN domain-containing protein [Paraglaciecola sp. G1-23]